MKFPPTIYYKIYSHINVADIGAFAPRDYTNAMNKDLPWKIVHNNNFHFEGNYVPKSFLEFYFQEFS